MPIDQPESPVLNQQTYIAAIRKALNNGLFAADDLAQIQQDYKDVQSLSLDVRFENPVNTKRLSKLTTAADAANMINTPMTIAAFNNDVKSMQQLADMGASITYPDGCGYTPLNVAAGAAATTVVSYLLKEKPEVLKTINDPSTDNVHATPLMNAIVKSNFNPVIRILLDNKAQMTDAHIKNFTQVIAKINADPKIAESEKGILNDILSDFKTHLTEPEQTETAIAETALQIPKQQIVKPPQPEPKPEIRKAIAVIHPTTKHKPASLPHEYSRYYEGASGASTGRLLTAIAENLHIPVTGKKLTAHNLELLEQAGFTPDTNPKGHKVIDVAKLETFIAGSKTKGEGVYAATTHTSRKSAKALMEGSILDLPRYHNEDLTVKDLHDDNFKPPSLFGNNTVKPPKHL